MSYGDCKFAYSVFQEIWFDAIDSIDIQQDTDVSHGVGNIEEPVNGQISLQNTNHAQTILGIFT